MTTKLFASGATRAMFASSTSPFPMLRGPAVTYAEDDDSGGGQQTEGGGQTQTGAGDDTLGGGAGDDDLGGDDTESGDDSGSETTGGGAGDDSLGGGGGEDEVDAGRQRVPWQNRRIDKLTAEKNALAEENARLKREKEGLEALGGETQTAPDPQAGGARTYTEEEVDRRASEKAANRLLNEKVDSLYDDAKALDPKFESRLPALREAAGDVLAQRADFWSALTKFPNGAAVMNELTKDLDQLSEFLELAPVDLGIELAKLSTSLGKEPPKPKLSKVPPPVVPITDTRTAETGLLALDDDAFAETRAAQRAAHRERQR